MTIQNTETTSSAGATALPAGYTLHEGYPPLPEYLDLRKLSGLTPVSPEQGAAVPRGSWYGVYITTAEAGAEEQEGGSSTAQPQPSSNGVQTGESPASSSSTNTNTTSSKPGRKAVAMGRIIGDGGWYFVIADMAVLPGHQRRGLGDAIVKRLVDRVYSHGAKGQAYVSLTADPPGRKLYARNEFVESMPRGMGMHRLLQVPGGGDDGGEREGQQEREA
ncbi:uncharacterized protein B0I36DRAFT_1954 [Microdochium trichocladiopsis]|uniref:N-acetyltransferase domain-containing protein n=1 Tax=Microdochium trichocladiopsis TaxID=1682393 RepID=A0A9P8YDF1_9PEZI|nr:uncharacterized protein B0I36DRAFT_1954 [Microdochium trichocladiopsis]KAH7039767.1 hypothetical protein B0I36DRAFT_1954 [Microdochium trichocladiopsis]